MPSSRMTIDSFVGEYHEMEAKSASDGVRRPLPFAGLGPLPQLLAQGDKPSVIYWLRELFQGTPEAQQKGETDGNATIIAQKNKVGRPLKSTDANNIPGNKHKHIYLEREDGTPISVLDLRLLSNKAHKIWETLLNHGWAPKSWGKISSVASDFHARSILNTPGLEFLQLCDDGQWKLMEWTQQNYSGWAWRNGLWEARPKKESREPSTLDDKALFQIDPSEEPEDIRAKSADESEDSTDPCGTADDQDPKSDSGVGISHNETDTTASTEGPGASLREKSCQPVRAPLM
jgi:hypothetical protein